MRNSPERFAQGCFSSLFSLLFSLFLVFSWELYLFQPFCGVWVQFSSGIVPFSAVWRGLGTIFFGNCTYFSRLAGFGYNLSLRIVPISAVLTSLGTIFQRMKSRHIFYSCSTTPSSCSNMRNCLLPTLVGILCTLFHIPSFSQPV